MVIVGEVEMVTVEVKAYSERGQRGCATGRAYISVLAAFVICLMRLRHKHTCVNGHTATQN